MSAPRVLDLSSGVRSAETPKDLSRWHGKKEVLYDLYICRGKTLEDVKSIMESDHGFPKTLKLSDYEHVLREEFKYRKYLSADDWRLSVGPHIARRKAHGKLSEVTLNGSKVPNVDRRIRRSLQSKRTHRRANNNDAALPHGVVIRTPSPQPSTFVAPPTFGRSRMANEIEGHQLYHSTMDYLADSPFAADSELLSLLTVFMPLSDAGRGTIALSAHLLREGCPINQLLIILDEHQRRFNPTDLRLFGPNATIGILGKMCFDFSNSLQESTVSNGEMTSILDWIGSSVDIASFKAFFSQQAFTIFALWETLNSIVRQWKHSAAFEVLLSVHSSITEQAPWTIGERYYGFSWCIHLAPNCAATLINSYSCDQCELDTALRNAVPDNHSIELVKQLTSAGASLEQGDHPYRVESLIRDFRSQESWIFDLPFVEMILKAGAVVDELSPHDRSLGWADPDVPICATDSLILSEGQSKPHQALLRLFYSYSDRQQTTVTVPGIFTSAQGGQEQLQSYLNTHSKPHDKQDRMYVLEVALSEASARGHVDVVRSLLQFGVDPNVRLLPWYKSIWHPVIRAVNSGQLEALRLLVAISSFDISLLNTDMRMGSQLDLWALRNMERSQRDQFLHILSTLDLATDNRRDILLLAIKPRHCDSGHDYPNFEFANQLLELGLACVGDRQPSHILLLAIKRHCGIKALKYLVERDVEVLSGLPADVFGVLLEATLELYCERQEILKFLAQNVEGFQSYIQENGSFLLTRFVKYMRCLQEHDHALNNRGDDCEAMLTVKWFMDLGARLKGPVLFKLIQHASESFMLAMFHRVENVDAADYSDALQWSISSGQINLAVKLIERDSLVNGPLPLSGGRITLQQACKSSAPLSFIRFLVDKGAEVNASLGPFPHRTALQVACACEAQLSCIKFLIEKGADINAPPAPNGGFTALQYAAKNGMMNVVGLLLDHGADVNAPSRRIQGRSHHTFARAIDVAARYSRLDMVHFLIAAGAESGQPGSTGLEGAIEIATAVGNCAIACLLQAHAEIRSGGSMEVERRWLLAYPEVCMRHSRMRHTWTLP